MNVKVADRWVGHDHPPYLIAEIGSNHNGDIALAKRMIDEAKRCGADAVKFQSWSATSLIAKGEYERNTEYADTQRHFGSLREMVEAYQLTPPQHVELVEHCARTGVHFLSSAFSPEEVELLVEVGVPAIKIASMDVTHPLLLRSVGRSGKPVILSTGLSSLDEIASAVATLREHGCEQLILLHCVSLYPPDDAEVRLRNIPMLRDAFEVPVGFSDHSLGVPIALAAVALGACVVEKHFTLDSSLQGWDHWMSAEPAELEALCRGARQIYAGLGGTSRVVGARELEKRSRFRRCIVLRRAVPAGHVLTLEDLDFKRPGTGIAPTDHGIVTGRMVKRDLEADHELSWSDLS
jgi:N,N'-diacetyllegionaminate synthase